jgi:uncharacterized membrane protein
MLIVFPLGLLVSAVIFDIIFLATRNGIFATIAFYNIAGGIIGGVLASIFGFRDFTALPDGTRAKRIGLLHGYGNLALLFFFSVSWLFRWNAPDYQPPILALVISFGAVLLGVVTAWLGGELVERLAVGVDPGANVNAPSSLSDLPTTPAPTMTQVPVTGPEREQDEP